MQEQMLIGRLEIRLLWNQPLTLLRMDAAADVKVSAIQLMVDVRL